tara:strand:- start:697 stop:903 length:207 start_codon:yes stop_codon:yes gene_type:complete
LFASHFFGSIKNRIDIGIETRFSIVRIIPRPLSISDVNPSDISAIVATTNTIVNRHVPLCGKCPRWKK